MATNPATVDDLRLRWHPSPLDDPEQELVAATRLGEAWRALLREDASVATRMDAGDLDLEVVVDVVTSAALRVLRNPENHAEGSVRLDDYAETWKANPSTVTSDLYFTAAELRRVAARQLSGAFTIRPGR